MRCLWLTLADPDPPHNGQFLYSGGLIRNFAEAGASIEVLGFSRPGARRKDGAAEGKVVWRLAEHRPLSPWSSLTSTLPNIANRCRTPGMQRALAELLSRAGWDAIVFDNLSSGWALRDILKRYPGRKGRPKLIYISHNHEESLRRQVAGNQKSFLKRQALRLDAQKIVHLERALVESCDLVTAITPEDGRLYQAAAPKKPVRVLTPGYRGNTVAARELTDDMPRRAVIVGSFDWIAKRMNLDEFVRVADPIFAAHRVELQVIGSGEESFFDGLRKRVASTQFTGTVDDVNGYMREARIAIVPERSGGGFKLKVLDYVFNRLPIFALQGSVAGVPLRHPDSLMLFSDQEALARGVVRAIDDLDNLNSIQGTAFEECNGQFDWAARGTDLASAIAAL